MSDLSRPRRRLPHAFLLRAPEARQVFLAGTFNGWDPRATAMRLGQNRLWSVTLELEPGRHEYKYVIDGQWKSEPGTSVVFAEPRMRSGT